jgi:2-C-methyl-D-erythritol 2,4-cyclodiphosphate synthase
MRERVAHTLEASVDRVNIKATTTEQMGFCGKKEGIESFAVVSLVGDAGHP